MVDGGVVGRAVGAGESVAGAVADRLAVEGATLEEGDSVAVEGRVATDADGDAFKPGWVAN
jgi:hypothetical protein